MKLIDQALKDGRTTLSEYESKQVLASYGIPVTQEELVLNPEDLSKAIPKISYPLVMKGCAAEIAHKTEKGLIRVDVRNEGEARTAYKEVSYDLHSIDITLPYPSTQAVPKRADHFDELLCFKLKVLAKFFKRKIQQPLAAP